MREGTRDFGNQAFFERNLLPHMIGWFELRTAVAEPPSLLGSAATAAAGVELEASTLDDFEWMLAKAAGYDAGFAVVGQLGNLHGNGQTSAILTAVKQWEALRLAHRFSDLQRQKLRSADEFHLESIEGGRWQLRPVDFSPRHRLALAGGQAVKEKWEIVNRFTQQPLRFVLRVTADAGGSVKARAVNPSFQTGGRQFHFSCRTQAAAVPGVPRGTHGNGVRRQLELAWDGTGRCRPSPVGNRKIHSYIRLPFTRPGAFTPGDEM